jgi:hypothetical protein
MYTGRMRVHSRAYGASFAAGLFVCACSGDDEATTAAGAGGTDAGSDGGHVATGGLSATGGRAATGGLGGRTTGGSGGNAGRGGAGGASVTGGSAGVGGNVATAVWMAAPEGSVEEAVVLLARAEEAVDRPEVLRAAERVAPWRPVQRVRQMRAAAEPRRAGSATSLRPAACRSSGWSTLPAARRRLPSS